MADTDTLVNENSPAYPCAAYLKQKPAWDLCQDVKGGTPIIRSKRETYLPRFPSESADKWDARVKMTFVRNYYEQTLVDHVGLIFANPPVLNKDVPEALVELLENIDGEGTHWEVFTQRALTAALDYGHVVLVTDYPPVGRVKTLSDSKRAKQRAYATMYSADDVLSWRVATVGGVVTLVQIVLRERVQSTVGLFGSAVKEQYRVLQQEVLYDEAGDAVGLGAMRWSVWTADSENKYSETSFGPIVGPAQLPVRVVYGGTYKDMLISEPHLLTLADTVVELTQVSSDYANVMHKCNVPTPVFIGRPQAQQGNPVVTGEGLDIPQGGDAKWLEPSGGAIPSTERRIAALERQLQRQGAFVNEPSGPAITAMEASLYAKQRSAKLVRATRSLQDGMEGVLADMAAFMDVELSKSDEGGSIVFDTSFGTETTNAAMQMVFIAAYEKGLLTLEEGRQALRDGKLPDDFDISAGALELSAASEEEALMEAEQAKRDADALKAAAANGGAPPAAAAPDAGAGDGDVDEEEA